MVQVSYGSARQVWLARLSAPNTKYPFIIRDDTYSKQGAQFGRSIRLGDPVNLGPNSAWTTTSWEGGDDQDVWSDPQMFKSGNADMNTKTGKLRMWPGWRELFYSGTRPVTGFVLGRGQMGDDLSGGPLYFGETDYFGLGYVAATSPPSGGFRFYKYTPAAGEVLKGNAANALRSISTFADPSSFNKALFITESAPGLTTTTGKSTYYYEVAGTFSDELSSGHPVGAMYPHNVAFLGKDTFVLTGQQVAKLNYSTGGWTNLHQVYSGTAMGGIAVWNNRVWFGAQHGAKAEVWVTDGISTAKAIDIPDEFNITHMHVHYGSLFISGWRAAAAEGTVSFVGVIWKYTGSTLIKLYEEGDGIDGYDHVIYKMCSLGPNLVWNKNGIPSETPYRAGVKMWNAETDAIFDGPTIDCDPASTEGVMVTDVIEYDNSLVASFRDKHNYGGSDTHPALVAQVRPENYVRNYITGPAAETSFTYQELAEKKQHILSSVYFGEADTEAELKTWLSARVRVKIPSTYSSINLYAILDEDEDSEVLVDTIAYDAGDLGWRSVDIQMKDVGGDYLQSYSIQYRVELVNSAGYPLNSTDNPMADSISIQWRPVPTRRRQWAIRCVNQDDLTLLDGEENTALPTAQEQSDLLEDLWAEGKPVLFWGPYAHGTEPATAGTEVVVNAFSAQEWRVRSDDDVVQQEVALTLVENV
jgi:hypothetical protein